MKKAGKQSFHSTLPAVLAEADCVPMPGENHTPPSRITSYTRFPGAMLQTGFPAAPRKDRLMLLGSPPDMIHGFRSHRTHPSTHIPRCGPHKKHPQRRHHPCYSGFQVQDTAATPASMVLSGHRTLHIYYNRPLPLMQEQIQKICKFSCKSRNGKPL